MLGVHPVHVWSRLGAALALHPGCTPNSRLTRDRASNAAAATFSTVFCRLAAAAAAEAAAAAATAAATVAAAAAAAPLLLLHHLPHPRAPLCFCSCSCSCSYSCSCSCFCPYFC